MTPPATCFALLTNVCNWAKAAEPAGHLPEAELELPHGNCAQVMPRGHDRPDTPRELVKPQSGGPGAFASSFVTLCRNRPPPAVAVAILL